MQTKVIDISKEPNCTIRELALLVRSLHNRLRFSQDTLYVCFKLLSGTKFEIPLSKAKLFAASLVNIAGKVH